MRNIAQVRTAAAAVMVAVAAACSSPAPATIGRSEDAVGFILVGSRRDLGYNQAVWEASRAVARAYPEVPVLRREFIPETKAAEAALEAMIDEGAAILFATSLGHLPAAVAVARRHPEVVVLHQGGREPKPGLANFGTYFGRVYEPAYVAGVAAAAASRTGRLGFVAAFPRPSVFNNVNAFTLGARSVKPEAVTEVRFTGRWCDPVAQTKAAESLVAAGADVLAQHQDCTEAVLVAAEAAGVKSVGFHYDGSEVATTGWVAGPAWDWAGLFTDIVSTVRAGNFEASPYNGDFLGSFSTGDNPMILTEPGPGADAAANPLMDAAAATLRAGGSPFTGPLRDRNGLLRVPAGTTLNRARLDRMDWFVEGVVGGDSAG